MKDYTAHHCGEDVWKIYGPDVSVTVIGDDREVLAIVDGLRMRKYETRIHLTKPIDEGQLSLAHKRIRDTFAKAER